MAELLARGHGPGGDERVPAHVVDAGFQVQARAHRHGLPGVAEGPEQAAELLGPRLVGALREADEEASLGHEHVAAVHRAGRIDAVYLPVAGQDRLDSLLLAPAGRGARARDDGRLRRDYRDVFHEVGVRVLGQGLELDYLQAQGAQGHYV